MFMMQTYFRYLDVKFLIRLVGPIRCEQISHSTFALGKLSKSSKIVRYQKIIGLPFIQRFADLSFFLMFFFAVFKICWSPWVNLPPSTG